MPRRRMIDPNIWQSEDFSKLSTLAKLIFIGMFSLADDEGKGRGKPVYLKSVLFPYDDTMRLIDVEKTLSEISSNMSVTFYSHDGNEYYIMNNWKKWQTVDKPQPSKIPNPTPIANDSRTVLDSVENDSRLIEENIREVNVGEDSVRHTEHFDAQHTPDVFFGEFQHVRMTQAEYDKLVGRFGEKAVLKKIVSLDCNIQNKVKKYCDYKDHYATILNWCKKDGDDETCSQTEQKSGFKEL